MDALPKVMMRLLLCHYGGLGQSGTTLGDGLSSATLMGADCCFSLGKNLVFPAIRLFIILWAAGLMSENPTLQKGGVSPVL